MLKGFGRKILAGVLTGIMACNMMAAPALAAETKSSAAESSASASLQAGGAAADSGAQTGMSAAADNTSDSTDEAAEDPDGYDAADAVDASDGDALDISDSSDALISGEDAVDADDASDADDSQAEEITLDDADAAAADGKDAEDAEDAADAAEDTWYTNIDGGTENVPVDLIQAAEEEMVSLADSGQVTSSVDFVQYALDIAYSDDIGYGHGWAAYDQSTISCSGLVGVSLTACGYGDFTSGYENGWGYQGLSDSFVANLKASGFTKHYSYGSKTLKAGDILLYITSAGYQHAGIYVGNGLIVEAMGDENGDGDNGCDASGNEVICHTNHNVWTDIYRNSNLQTTGTVRFNAPCSAGSGHKVSYSRLAIKLCSKGLKIHLYGLTIKNASTGDIKNPSSVNMACWTEKGGQNDLVWVTAQRLSDGSYVGYYDGYKNYGTVNVHIYANHNSCTNIFVKARTATITQPAVKKVAVKKLTNYRYRYTITFNNIVHASEILCPTWYTKKGTDQNYLRWIQAKKTSSTTCTFIVNTKLFNKYSGKFVTHVYVKCGQVSLKNIYQKTKTLTSGTVCSQNGKHIVKCSSLVAVKSGKKTKVTMKGLVLKDANNKLSKTPSVVRFACWTEKNGQDDLQWIEAVKQSDGSYVGYYTARKHKGTLNVHAYVDHGKCTNILIGKTTA